MLQACCEFSGPRWHGRKSAHFEGERFHNRIEGTAPGAVQVVRRRMARKPGPWPKWIEVSPAPPPPPRVAEGELRVTFVNHATVLIQVGEIARGASRARQPAIRDPRERRELYQLTSGGRLMKMASTLPPLLRPKSVPRS